MASYCRLAVFVLFGLLFLPGGAAPARGQQATPAATNAADAERQKIISSDRWRQTIQRWNEWLSVQQTYTAEQVAVLRADINDRVATMSPKELEKFLDDMEERLVVLMSPEADEAREWIAQILRVARNPETHFGGPLPDVAHMTASQIREELDRFQRRQASRRQQQAAFDRNRQAQVQAAQDVHASRQRAAATPRTAATFPEVQIPDRGPYSPAGRWRRTPSSRAIYRVGPWGEPIYWNPMRDWRPWDLEW